ncbi:MAG: leucyl/phenylalanyl-tRNA--protein transferase, partial [Deltaproteobacteria bacterium]|nr:leucyl/phenylalanyl-tRNA--protein transferase [Deltaproteobacteria bacterium]
MPIFRLVDEPIFPPPDYADPSGLLAVGGDLSSERLLEA